MNRKKSLSKRLRCLLFFIVSLFYTGLAMAQDDGIEMADLMFENGKIYVVVAVVAVILAGFLIFLISIDSRVRKLEKSRKKE